MAEQDTERPGLLRKAYTAATTRLRESRRDEFDALYQEEARKLGVEYTPRLSPEQRAEEEIKERLTRFPHLAERYSSDS